MGELVGYMRVSTKEQKFDLQQDRMRCGLRASLNAISITMWPLGRSKPGQGSPRV
jgi:hypothetical protein